MITSLLLALLSLQDGVGLADMATCFLRFEATLEQSPPIGDERARVSRAFDSATKRFFTADLDGAVQAIDELRAELLSGEEEQACARLCASLRLVVDDPVVPVAEAAQISVRVESVYEVLLDDALEVRARLVVRDGRGAVRAEELLVIGDDEAVELEVELALDPPPSGPGSFEIELIGPAGRVHAATRWGAAPAWPKDAAATNEEGSAQLRGEHLSGAVQVFRARNRLLLAEPRTDASALSRLDPVELQLELASELEALRAGVDPYVDRRGESWRVIAVGESELPLRLYVPESGEGDAPLPLVVALHGAGGNEHLFFDGYGRGTLRREAEQRGFLLAAPSSYAFLSDDAAFDALMAELERCYPIDLERVYVLGHSLGAGASARLARTRGDRIAAAACLAGGGGFEERSDATPLFVGLGALDSIVPPARIAASAERAIAAGREVELIVLEDRGHTLMVAELLPAALGFFRLPRRS